MGKEDVKKIMKRNREIINRLNEIAGSYTPIPINKLLMSLYGQINYYNQMKKKIR